MSLNFVINLVKYRFWFAIISANICAPKILVIFPQIFAEIIAELFCKNMSTACFPRRLGRLGKSCCAGQGRGNDTTAVTQRCQTGQHVLDIFQPDYFTYCNKSWKRAIIQCLTYWAENRPLGSRQG